MQNSEFEKSVKEQVHDLDITPQDELWNKIANNLPEQKKQRRWVIPGLFFILLSITTLLTFDNGLPGTNADKSSADTNNQNLKNNASIPPKAGKTASQNVPPGNDQSGMFLPMPEKIVTATNTYITINFNKEHLKKSSEYNFNPGISKKKKTSINYSTQGAYQVTITSPQMEQSLDDSIATQTEENTSIAASPREIKKDDSLTIPGTIPENNKNGKNDFRKSWAFGIHFSTGKSDVKNGLFNPADAFMSTQGNLSSGNPGAQTGTPPQLPTSSSSFDAGFYASKLLNKHWSFNIGLLYSYQSTNIKTGTRVDTSAVVNYRTGIFKATSVYRTGNEAEYKNEFHMISLPLFIQYRISGNWPAYLEVGPGISYLAHSNALIYNHSLNGYITNEAIFNQLIPTVNAGAGMHLDKFLKLPVSLGFKCQYGLGSITKKEYGEQHLFNSAVYLNIQLKK